MIVHAKEESGGADPLPSARSQAFLVLCAMGLVGRLSYEMLRTPVTSLYARHLGAPTALIGLLVSAVTVTGIVVKLPAGSMADRFGARRLMGAGLTVKATAPFLYFLAATPLLLLAVRFYHGLSTALYAPAASAEAARLFPTQRGRRLGIYGAAENAGVVLGPVLGAMLIQDGGFTAVFAVSGVVGVLALLPILAYRPPAAAAAPESGTAPRPGIRQVVAGIVRDPAIRAAGFVEATLYAAIGTLQAFLPLYATGRGLTVGTVGLLLAAQGVASVALRPWAGWLGDRWGRGGLIAAGALACTAALAGIPHAGRVATLLPLMVLFGAGTAAVTPSTTALIGERARAGSLGSAMGVFGSIWDLGHASGPLVAGLLITALGYGWTFSIIAATLLAALAMFLNTALRPQPAVAAEAPAPRPSGPPRR